MERIIAGRFGTKAEADIAAQRILGYINDDDVSIFHNNEKRVIRDLTEAGAADIEQADGEWRDGDWVDFDPRAVPQLVPTN